MKKQLNERFQELAGIKPLNEAFPKFLKGEAEKLDKEFSDILNKSLKDDVDQIKVYKILEDLKRAIYNQGKKESTSKPARQLDATEKEFMRNINKNK